MSISELVQNVSFAEVFAVLIGLFVVGYIYKWAVKTYFLFYFETKFRLIKERIKLELTAKKDELEMEIAAHHRKLALTISADKIAKT